MEPSELLAYVADVLERIGIPYFVTGSTGTIFFGEPRFTNDIDIVVDLPADKVHAISDAFAEPEFYISHHAVREAVQNKGQFNIIHPESGLKVDMMIRQPTPFDRSRFARAVRGAIETGREVAFASPEDLIISKLQFFEQGRSEKHLRDIAGVIRVTGERLDHQYIADWAARLGLDDLWDMVRSRSE